ncbi:hypothetical protein KP509_03G098300 [Ceratopteris richardii]|nr:hypothetical protein KP509_03G098300 [Ceratopteris richardii]
MISKLISEADPELVYAEDKDGDSFFHVAAKYGNMNVFEALDKARIDMAPLLPHRNGRDLLNSPGMYALLYDQREFFNELAARHDVKITLSSIVKALIFELIDKPEIQERLALFGSTLPTYLALYANKHFVFEFLLCTLLSLSQWDGKYYRTCLHWAIVDRRADIVQKISTNKKLWQQWPGIQDRDGKTVQQLAFEQKNHMVMELLSGKASFKEHEEKLNKDREVYVQALNAILVGAALIASVTFAGWLQVPYESEFSSTAMRIYWATNSVSFFTAVATMCVTTIGLIPTPSQYVGVIVAQLRVTILLDAFLLALSLAAVMLAFAAAGFAALRHAHIYEYQVIMRSTAAVGGVICLITWLAYVYQLTNCTPSRTYLLYSLLPSFRFSFLGRCWCPRWVEKMRTRLGDSSRLGYQNMEKEELSKRMDEDLVPIYLSPRLNSVTHTASECSIPDVKTLERLLKDLEIEDKERFIMDISNHQRKVESITYKNERITTLARRCKVGEDQSSEQ